MEYEPLTSVWPQHGLVSVTLGALRDAGFHPVIECDPRGWMHYYGWPWGSSRAVTVWVPRDELEDARGFMDAPCSLSCEPSDTGPGCFWDGLSRSRRLVYGAWLLSAAGLSPITMVLAGMYGVADCLEAVEEAEAEAV